MKKSLLLVAICFFCIIHLLHADEASPFVTKPYLQNPSQESVTIMWHTKQPAYGWVEYGETDKLGIKSDMVVDGLRRANTTIHKVRLRDLKPGSTYYYRVCAKPIIKFAPYKVTFGDAVYSKTYTFKSISSNPKMSCVIFNDLHDKYAVFNKLCDILDDRDYQFSIFNGDCFSDPRSKTNVLEALTVYNDGVSAHTHPALYIRGNHEIRGAFARELKSIFDFPDNEYFFALTAGPVRFIFLDCGEDKSDDHWAYSGLNDFSFYRKRQQEWLKEEVKSDDFLNAKYRILIHHIPLYNRGDKWVADSSRALWSSVLDSASIDVAISGHTHKYDFISVKEAGNSYPVLIGGGPKLDNATVIVLSATDKQLSIEMLNANGETVGKYDKLANEELKETDKTVP